MLFSLLHIVCNASVLLLIFEMLVSLLHIFNASVFITVHLVCSTSVFIT